MRKVKDSRVYLDDMLKALGQIRRYTKKGKRQFFAEEVIQDAVIRQLAIIGEAAARLPQDVKDQTTEISWRLVIGMRNNLVHEYAELNLDTVRTTVDRDLPLLQKAIKDAIEAA